MPGASRQVKLSDPADSSLGCWNLRFSCHTLVMVISRYYEDLLWRILQLGLQSHPARAEAWVTKGMLSMIAVRQAHRDIITNPSCSAPPPQLSSLASVGFPLMQPTAGTEVHTDFRCDSDVENCISQSLCYYARPSDRSVSSSGLMRPRIYTWIIALIIHDIVPFRLPKTTP